MAKIIHSGLDVRGALKWPKGKLKGMFKHESGRFTTADESRNILLDELAEGHEILPLGPCENWDWKTGCQGCQAADGPVGVA